MLLRQNEDEDARKPEMEHVGGECQDPPAVGCGVYLASAPGVCVCVCVCGFARLAALHPNRPVSEMVCGRVFGRYSFEWWQQRFDTS